MTSSAYATRRAAARASRANACASAEAPRCAVRTSLDLVEGAAKAAIGPLVLRAGLDDIGGLPHPSRSEILVEPAHPDANRPRESRRDPTIRLGQAPTPDGPRPSVVVARPEAGLGVSQAFAVQPELVFGLAVVTDHDEEGHDLVHGVRPDLRRALVVVQDPRGAPRTALKQPCGLPVEGILRPGNALPGEHRHRFAARATCDESLLPPRTEASARVLPGQGLPREEARRERLSIVERGVRGHPLTPRIPLHREQGPPQAVAKAVTHFRPTTARSLADS